MLADFLYMPSWAVIWDPFVSSTGVGARRLKRAFHGIVEVIHSKEYDLLTGKIPHGIDMIITNPPFSKKKETIAKLFNSNIPFCVLLPLEALARQYMRTWLIGYSSTIRILMPSEKVHFEPLHAISKKKSSSPFHSVWLCNNIEELHANTILPLRLYYHFK